MAKRRPPSTPAETAPQEEPGLVDQLRSAIEDSGLSHREIARRSGVNQRAIDRFMSGARTITVESADRLCQALRLRLIPLGPPPETSPAPPP